MRLLVIDGNSIANRAFFGIKLLTTKDGRYTNAIYGFLNILLSLLKECEPDEVAVAFDLKAPTFRHKMYDGYKATRHGMPEELAQQMPVLKEVLDTPPFHSGGCSGYPTPLSAPAPASATPPAWASGWPCTPRPPCDGR